MPCAARGAIQCDARGLVEVCGLVAFAWCRRCHAFDGGIFRVGGGMGGWVGGGRSKTKGFIKTKSLKGGL